VILAAKTENAHYHLAEQFASRKVRKRYLAIVHGRVARQEGVIYLPIGRHPVNRQKMAVIANGEGRSREAETRYRVLERFKQATYLELEPTTGRTHQIRVHLSSVGHPILGDSLYGGGIPSLKIPRLALHAAAVTFAHPKNGKSLTFQAPVPNDLQELLKQIS
jgi:23S rRNA pseudouridine1911/1915/1917 synthase